MLKVHLAALAVLCLAVTAFARPKGAPVAGKGPKKFLVYFGTYTGGKSKGIYRATLDLATGKLSKPVLAGEMVNPSFLAIHPSKRYLYAVGEVSRMGDRATGGVTAFAINAKTGNLKKLNSQPSGGAGPCHLVVDATGKYVLAANYGGGSVCVLPIEEGGKLGKATAFVQHKGSSVNPARQKGPHAHSVNLDKANRFALVADLGLDKILVYAFDDERGTLRPAKPAFFKTEPGAGPRHFAFHPSGKFAYVINEIACTVTAMKYDPEKGKLTKIQTVSTLPGPVEKGYSTAEVEVHPSGKFLYGSNRGHNSIAVFSIDQETGKLTPVGRQGEGIDTPRNFGIDPTGKFVLVANQGSDSVLTFRVDPKTGMLKPTGHRVEVGRPVCVKFLPWEG